MDSLIALGCSYYLLHLLRVVEVVVGSNQYASVFLTLFCFLLPVKYALIHFNVGSNGFFFLTAGLAAYYMRILQSCILKQGTIPSSRLDSIPIMNGISISSKLFCLLILLLSTLGSRHAFLEAVLSYGIVFFILPRFLNPVPLIRCPTKVTRLLSVPNSLLLCGSNL